MKSLFTFLFLAFFSLSFAQNLSLDVESVHLELDGHIEYGDVLLTNTGTESIAVAVRLERVCYMADDVTKIQVCVGALCYFPTDQTTTWGSTGDTILLLEPNMPSDALKFTPGPIGTLGSSWNIVFYDRNNTADSTVLEVTIDNCIPTGVNDFEHEVGAAYPNPAGDFITIPYEFEANEASLLIYNAVGTHLESVVLDRNHGQVQVDVKDYIPGVYFYYISDGKGGQSRMLSFIK